MPGHHPTLPTQTADGRADTQPPPKGHAIASKLIRLPAVTARVGMRRTAVYGLIKAGKFPAPVKIGKASAWLDDEITQWIEELKQEREANRTSP